MATQVLLPEGSHAGGCLLGFFLFCPLSPLSLSRLSLGSLGSTVI